MCSEDTRDRGEVGVSLFLRYMTRILDPDCTLCTLVSCSQALSLYGYPKLAALSSVGCCACSLRLPPIPHYGSHTQDHPRRPNRLGSVTTLPLTTITTWVYRTSIHVTVSEVATSSLLVDRRAAPHPFRVIPPHVLRRPAETARTERVFAVLSTMASPVFWRLNPSWVAHGAPAPQHGR